MLNIPNLKIILLLLSFAITSVGVSQRFNNYQYFTTKEGLPSNFIYMCVQDKQGFLWVATDEGVLRFDGKNFELYTTENGLPDIEVLEVLMDSSGRIWANTFRHSPSYFDRLTNRFINANNDSSLRVVKNASVTFSFALRYGGVAFINNNGNYFFGRDAVNIKPIVGVRFCIENKKNELLIGYLHKAFLYKDDILKDSIVFDPGDQSKNSICKISGNDIYVVENDRVLEHYYDIDAEHKRFKRMQTEFATPVLYYSITRNYVCICLESGEIYLLEKSGLKTVQKLKITASMSYACEDSNGDLWMCTTDKGLIKASFDLMQKVPLPDSFRNTAFLCVAVDSFGNILAGNRFGEIVKKDNKTFEIKKIPNAKRTSWIRKIIALHKNTYIISEQGVFHNYMDPYTQPDTSTYPSLNSGFKTGVPYDDSTLLLGSIRYLLLINTFTRQRHVLFDKQRVTAVAVTPQHEIYFGSTNGLFKCIAGDSVSILSLNQKDELLGSRITALAVTKDNIVWASTASNGIIVLIKDSLVANITTQNNLASNLCRTVYVHDSTVWVATNSGISRINYNLKNNSGIDFSIQNLGEEGLDKELVNEMVQYHDTMYASTTNGIIFFPASITSKKEQVNTYITDINIHGRDTVLLSTFKLSYNQSNINLKFATIDLTGNTYTWQYRLNKRAWINTATNTISLQLSPGSYTVQIRPVDINHRIVERNAEINFIIKPAIWQTISFWIILSTLITAIVLWWYNHARIKNQARSYEQQIALMKERNRITADLHDDVGSSLSSLQIRSVIARQVIDTDVDKAKDYLDKVIEQSSDISSNISDIIWSMKPEKDRLIDLDGRIRNTVSNLLGPTNINYSINIEKSLENEVKNITARKNIMLIIKEATNNCTKYSAATEYRLFVALDEKTLTIVITDNGKGIPAEQMKNGNGMQNMRKRIEELNGTMCLETGENTGVQLKFTIPTPEIRL